jgi:hypothetical protein
MCPSLSLVYLTTSILLLFTKCLNIRYTPLPMSMGLGGYIIRWPRSHSITIQTTLTISFIHILIDKKLIEYKWKGPFLGWFVGHIVLIQETFALPWLPKSAQLKKIFLHHTLFQFICPHRTATWQAVVLGRLSLSMCLCLAWKKSNFICFSLGSIFDPKRKIQCMLPHYIIYILSLSPPLLRIFMMDLSTSSSRHTFPLASSLQFSMHKYLLDLKILQLKRTTYSYKTLVLH